MPRPPDTPWPTTPGSVFFGDVTSAATLTRAAGDGRIRRIARGLYTADHTTAPADLVARNRWTIVARLVPDALVADRSAAHGGATPGGLLTVVSSVRAERLVLPGLVVAPRRGPGPRADDLPWAAGLHTTSEARTLVDNLAVSRQRSGAPARTLSRDELGDWLVGRAQRRPDAWLVALRARALELCDELGVPERAPLVVELVGAVAGTRARRVAGGPLLRARRAGQAFDPDRVTRFDALADVLTGVDARLGVPASLPARLDEVRTSLPFFEAYFSNFIEGTEFSVDQAEAIVTDRAVPAERPADGHDVLGTFEAVADPALRGAVPHSADDWIDLLGRRHRLVMSGRPDKRPGRFKERPNQAGSYVFVAPPLVDGTLRAGFERLESLEPGFARAVFELFVVSEVHPYDDGNGRVARAAMGAQLSAAGQARIVIPIVFRNDYLTALRALSRDGRADLLVRTLAFAWRWTAAMPWHDRPAVDGLLVSTNALVDSTDAERSGVQLRLP